MAGEGIAGKERGYWDGRKRKSELEWNEGERRDTGEEYKRKKRGPLEGEGGLI